MQTQWALSWLPGNLFHALQGSLHFRIWSGFLKLWVICMTVKLELFIMLDIEPRMRVILLVPAVKKRHQASSERRSERQGNTHIFKHAFLFRCECKTQQRERRQIRRCWLRRKTPDRRLSCKNHLKHIWLPELRIQVWGVCYMKWGNFAYKLHQYKPSLTRSIFPIPALMSYSPFISTIKCLLPASEFTICA